MSKYGFSDTVQGIKYLDGIYDIIGWENLERKNLKTKFYDYLVFEDKWLENEQIKKYQLKLSKKFWDYSRKKMSREIILPQFKFKELEEKEKKFLLKYRQEQEEKEYNIQYQKNKNYGIYGIYQNDELIYIGSTLRSFDIRFNEHKENIQNKSKELYLYSLFNLGDKIEFKILIDCKELKTNIDLSKREIESMELALIQVFKPKGNLAGNTCQFRFT